MAERAMNHVPPETTVATMHQLQTMSGQYLDVQSKILIIHWDCLLTIISLAQRRRNKSYLDSEPVLHEVSAEVDRHCMILGIEMNQFELGAGEV